ncbi:type II toxin-antitoxin system VapC family toxin [Spirosoma fluviale]|uniref:Ribonuclease VapC n=1 Tax=Spirosoma fluviale TaxID=1597977 RepID=A0A286F8K2_9BACT|nr:PIN domain nuclease [Spirosoma fluviale]SOD79319.1 hypothetical protein SAMN06269250_0911 [Spirosoma fluviale]
MESILVDTSVWVDWFSRKNSHTRQINLLEDYLTEKFPVYTTAVVLQEVVQGVREDHTYLIVKDVLLNVPMLRLDPVEAAIGAADLYRSLRKKGVTIRKSNDCLIAHYAIFYDIPVLHNDADFDQIASHTALRIAV